MARTDAHAHVFARGLPLARGRRYAPGYDAPLAAYLALLDALGFARGVLVQPSFLGTDNDYLLAALARAPARLCGVAVVDPDCPGDELARLADAGVVGLRLNLIGADDPPLAAEPWAGLLRRAAERDLHVEVQCEARRLPRLLPGLRASGAVLVIDHFGLPDPRLGPDDPGWRDLLARAADDPGLWMKLSAPYRLGADGTALADRLAPLARAAFPERLVFGTDWPHTRHEGPNRAGSALRALDTWVPDPGARAACLDRSPARLFRFGAALRSMTG